MNASSTGARKDETRSAETDIRSRRFTVDGDTSSARVAVRNVENAGASVS